MIRAWRSLAFPVFVFAVALGVVAIGGAALGSPETIEALMLSGGMCLVHIVLGIVILEWSFERPPTEFLKRVLGGMALRLALMLAILAVVLTVGNVHTPSLMLGLLGWYVLALVFEIAALQKKVSLKQQAP